MTAGPPELPVPPPIDGYSPLARGGGRDSRPEDSAFVVELNAFTGPLDLLMTLIRDEKVDIYDIPIARIAEQFLARIRTLGLNEAADYLEMAARLLRIKAQMLLPRADGEDWEDPRAELVRRLLEYQQIREIVEVLERRADERRRQFARAFLPDQPAPARGGGPLALSLTELLAAVDRVLRIVSEPDMHNVVARALDVPAAIEVIRALLAIKARLRWTDVVRADAPPWQVLSALLGLLELARLGELRVAQSRPFANVEISRDPDPDDSSDHDSASEAA